MKTISLPLLTLAVIPALVVLIALGTWQWQRLQWKTALIEARTQALAAEPLPFPQHSEAWDELEYRRVAVRGSFIHAEELYRPGRKFNDVLGVDVLTPLELTDGRILLINRGTVPATTQSPDTRAMTLVAGEQEIIGIVRTDFRKGFFTPDAVTARREWYWYDLQAMREVTGLPLLPVVVEAVPSDTEVLMPQPREARVTLTNNHLQYVITWYGLAAALLGVYGAMVVSQRKLVAGNPRD